MLFGYRACQTLVRHMVGMQLKRAESDEDEVLNIPIIMGGVGTGKTSIARGVADQLGYELVKINCGECGDPTDISGLPVPWRIKDVGAEPYMEWVLNKSMHRACEEAVVLFFDDIDKAPALVEGALLSVFGERTARDRRLHPQTVVIAAGNRVGDDALARHLSESLRTRATVINLEATAADFGAYAKAKPEVVHPAILGFLQYKPGLLHLHNAEADRFPTPRTWVEASAFLFQFDVKEEISRVPAWKTWVALKCGEACAHDFWAWYSICSRIDVEKLLRSGEVDHNLAASADTTIVAYAAIFAVAQYLNHKGAKKEHKGLGLWLQDLHPEHRVALLTQLTNSARAKVAKTLPGTASILLSDIVGID